MCKLALARLVVAGATGVTRTTLAKDLAPLVQHRYVGAEWNATLDEALQILEARGEVRAGKGRKRFSITPSGEQHAFVFLDVDRLPAKTTWVTVKNVYLFAKAMGIRLDSPDKVKKISSASGVSAVILREAHALPTDPLPTPAQATDALLWKQLGRCTAEPFSMSTVKAYLLGQALGSRTKMSASQLVSAIAAKAVEARRNDRASLCQAALRRLLPNEAVEPEPQPQPSPASQPAPKSLEQFANDARHAGQQSPTGWFGDPAIANKVFVSHVYRSYAALYPDDGLSLDTFKERLVEANRAGLLRLSRADLVEAMDPEDVRNSQIRYLNAEFHFLIVRD